MDYRFISTAAELESYCQSIASSSVVAFDTEFVSEDRFLPELCLVQIAADGQYAVVDTLAVTDLQPFWSLLTEGNRRTIVHAGREEFRFCRRATGERPQDWFDIQLAAGLVGFDYPASYSSLLSKLMGKALSKHETRTDWRRRPLSEQQLKYALEDVVYLEEMHDLLEQRLEELGRAPWLAEELSVWQDALELTETRENWRRVSGINGLSPRSLAIVRALWRWRNGVATREDRPPRRVLRDDLIVELAKRKSADVKRIRAVRGLEYRGVKRHIDDIATATQEALDLSDEKCPRPPARSRRPRLSLVGQFLSTALGSICREARLAPSIVGTSQDVRDLIAFQLGLTTDGETPALAQGWRAEIVGSMIDDLLKGKLAVVIDDPLSAQPLSFRQVD